MAPGFHGPWPVSRIYAIGRTSTSPCVASSGCPRSRLARASVTLSSFRLLWSLRGVALRCRCGLVHWLAIRVPWLISGAFVWGGVPIFICNFSIAKPHGLVKPPGQAASLESC